MQIALTPKRVFHGNLMASELTARGHQVQVLSGATSRFFKSLPKTSHRLVPLPFAQASRLFHFRFNQKMDQLDSVAYDHAVAALFLDSELDLLIGWAGGALASARAMHRRGRRFALDRACPHVDFQQNLLREESERFGLHNEPHDPWFIERQIAEYEEADLIICPSRYSADTFPAALQSKIAIAPLLGRKLDVVLEPRQREPGEFVIGVLGGNLIRKGFTYLLQAWDKLRLPNARLIIRSDDIANDPYFAQRINRDDIEIIAYVDRIQDFYDRCDLFILPSIDDGFGMAAFEAMARGVPTILTDHCGASELVDHGQSGHVIGARSTDEIAAAIQRLYDDAGYRDQLGQGGARRVSELTGDAGNSIYGQALGRALETLAA